MRPPRNIKVTVVHHVISRFVDRAWEFRDDVERAMYLHRLGRALEVTDWRCLAYALMSNHIHLAMVAGTTDLGSWLKRTHSPFALWLNRRRGRLGPIFADRPKLWATRPAHEARLIAYIHWNPVRGHVTSTARASDWTSHGAYIGEAPVPRWLDVDDGLRRCGVARDGFDDWVQGVGPDLNYPSIAGVRRAAHRLGGVEVATSLADPAEFALVARAGARVRPQVGAVLAVVEDIVKVPSEQFATRARSKTVPLVRARQIAIRTGMALGLTIAEVSAALGLTRQAGSLLAARAVDAVVGAAVTLACDRLTTLTPSPAK